MRTLAVTEPYDMRLLQVQYILPKGQCLKTKKQNDDHPIDIFDSYITILSILSNPVYPLVAYLSRMYTKLKGVFPAAIIISAILMFTRK